MRAKQQSRLRTINREWWLVLSLFGVSAIVGIAPMSTRVLFFLYLAPVMVAAYIYGRRHAILTAIACVLLVLTGTVLRDVLFRSDYKLSLSAEGWGELLLWAGILIGFGWGLGWLFGDFRHTHEGFVDIMRYMVGRDNDRHNYVRRLSFVAGIVAEEMHLTPEQCETVRRAALLRDIGQLELSRDTFRRFSTICDEGDFEQALKQKDSKTLSTADHSAVKLGDVMDIVLAEKLYGAKFENIPVGARILALATEYDDLTTSKKRRSALPASVAASMIARESGKRFDPAVVRAFNRAYEAGAFSTAGARFSTAAG